MEKSKKVKTFIIGEIALLYRDSIDNLRSAKGINGSIVLKIRRILKPIIYEIKTYEEARNDKIKEYGELNGEGNYFINKESPRFKEYSTSLSQMINSEVSIELDEPISIESILTDSVTGISDTDIENLIYLGILFDPSEPIEEKTDSEKPGKEAV